MTTGKVYADFNELIKLVEKYISCKKIYLYRCNSDQVRKRVIQQIIELTNESFSQKALKIDGKVNDKSSQLLLNNIYIETLSGKVSISNKFLIIQIFIFLAEWGRILWKLIISFFTPVTRRSHATILAEAGGDYLNDDMQLVEFCRRGPILPLRDGLLIIGTFYTPKIQNDKNIIYSKTPYIELAIRTTSFRERLALLSWHLLSPLIIIHAIFFNKILLILGKDIASLLMISFLDRKNKLKDIVLTTSAFASQLIWMKGLKNQIFKLNMIWYSQNFIPKAYVGETNRPDLPSARHMRVDKHWVWTNGFKDYLQELGQSSEILVVGPLLWHLDSLDNIYKSDEYISIAIFDINPLPDGNNPFGAIKNYYSTSLMKKFIIDILDLKEEIENITGEKVKFYLKHKRIPKKDYHDNLYFSFLSDLLNTRKDLEFVNSNENLFQLIKKTDFSIAVPYTSTCYVGSHCKKNAIYYDPFGELIPLYEKNEYVDFASGQNQLLGIVKRLVINYKSVK